MATLYRKYRPLNFKEVVGQNHIKTTLQNEIESEKIAHAYLFTGPRAVGKTTLARVFASSLNCVNRKTGEHEPCGKCNLCTESIANSNIDVIEIDAASHTGVDNVRENIINSARITPSNSKYKVFIIDEVHMLSTAAFNALLKIVEEPPKYIIFILCTTEIHKVPSTIISRCQRFDFKRINLDDVVKKLKYICKSEDIKIDDEVLESIAIQSEGHMRDAESILGQVISISGKIVSKEDAALVIPSTSTLEIIKLIDYLVTKDASKAVALINKQIDEGIEIKNFTNNFLTILRKAMFTKINPRLSDSLTMSIGDENEKRLNQIIGNTNLEFLIRTIEEFVKARTKIKDSFIIQMPLEIAIITICSNIHGNVPRSIAPHPQIPKPNNNTNPVPNPSSKPAELRVSSQQPSNPAPQAAANENLNIDEIKIRWPQLLSIVKKDNHSLAFILKACRPKNYQGNKLFLAFKYKFHKERIEEPKINQLIQNALNEVYGGHIEIETVIDETVEINGNGAIIESKSSHAHHQIEDKHAESSNKNNSNVDKKKSANTKGDNPVIDNLLKTFGGKVVG